MIEQLCTAMQIGLRHGICCSSVMTWCWGESGRAQQHVSTPAGIQRPQRSPGAGSSLDSHFTLLCMASASQNYRLHLSHVASQAHLPCLP